VGSRRWPGRLWLTVAAAAVLLASVGLPAGCRAPAVALAEPWGAVDACGATATLDEAALGAALAYTADDAPKDLDALAALIAAHPASVDLVEAGAGTDDPVARAAAGLGRPACRRPLAGRVRVQAGPVGVGRIARARPATGVVAEKLVAAGHHLQAGEDAEARTALQAAAAYEPEPVPGTLLAIGDSYARAGRWGDAQSFYAEATRRFPYAAAGWAGLGRAQRAGERRLASLAATSRALALFPGDQATRAMMADDPFISLLAPVSPPALPDGQPGRWRMVAAANPFTRAEAQAYADCRQSFRRRPDLRRRLAGREIPPGRWSPAEESACTALWLRAYLAHRGQGREADAGLDDLIEVAREGLMDERALHDVAGLADPRLLWLIDEGRRTRLFEFVERHRVMPRQDVGVLSPF
jgi:tetratricopeptide (TPR) repeat protein